MSTQLPSATEAKDQARRLREKLAKDGRPVGHAKSLELIAHQHGFRDWNAMFAAIGNGAPKALSLGETVSGTYLSQPFTARVVSVAAVKRGWFKLELHLDEPVDVVMSQGFSNFRRRIRGVIGPKGHTLERTSDGQPHLQIDLRKNVRNTESRRCPVSEQWQKCPADCEFG